MSFQAFRSNGAPTYYDAVHTPWEADLLTTGLVFCLGILALSFYIILPGARGWERLFSFIRITLSLFIGGVILVTQFSMTWENAETYARTKYKAGTGEEVNVTIGAWIGFRGVNITMKGEPNQIKGETIDYNENFSWEGLQGRIGFGPFAGRFNQEYRSAQFRGLPLPILWAAEYFTFDGEGIRWGRFYRQAGWYAHIMLWLAFPLWLLSNILFCVLLRFGAYFLMMTGLSMITSNIIWATLRNFIELEIPFTDTAKLEFSYGLSFWVCLGTGIVSVVLGVLIFVLDKLNSTMIATFFNVDVLQDSEQIIEEDDDGEDEKLSGKRNGAGEHGGSSTSGARSGEDGPSAPGDTMNDDDEDEELYLPPPPMQALTPPKDRAAPHVLTPPGGMFKKGKPSYRSAENRMTKRFQKPRRRAPPPVPSGRDGQFDNLAGRAGADSDDDGDVYENEATVQALRMKQF